MAVEASMDTTGGSGVAADLAKGAIAGAVGVWVMDRVDWFMVEHGDQEAWRRTQAVRPNGKDPAHNMAGLAARAVGASPPPQPHPIGIATHYAVGVAPAVAYAVTRRHLPGGILSRGLILGLGMFLVEDEIVNPIIGVAAPPQRYPLQAHARGLIAHLVLGVVTETVLASLDRPRRRSRSRPTRAQERNPRPDRGRRMTQTPQQDSYGVRFPLQLDGRLTTVVVTHEALHKAEGALTGGPIDQDELVALERYRSRFEDIATRKLRSGQVERDGTVRVTTMDLSSLGT
jgi:hypothetical protein